MRALIIGPEDRENIQKVMAYAKDHHYREGDPIPGNNHQFVAMVPMEYKCVFTFTHAHGRLYRHLTVSIPGKKYPSPEALTMLAIEFGFTGVTLGMTLKEILEAGWLVSVDENHHCCVAVQPLEDQSCIPN